MEQASTWSIAGIGAIAGLIISNLDSVGEVVSRDGIRTSLILFTASLIFGAISKQIGMALCKGLISIQTMENLLNSQEGKDLFKDLSLSPEQLARDLSEPYLWPLSVIFKRSSAKGVDDYLYGDKKLIKLFCWQLLFIHIHGLLAAAALIVIAISI